jgi:hypothetical protein
MNNEPKKHHYIPRFYLKGFVNGRGDFYVFDKAKEEIRKARPDNSFYEKFRNTGYAKDAKTNLLENIYADYDSRAAKVFEDVRNSKLNDPVLTPHNLAILRLFIVNLFWRIPSNDSLLNTLIDTRSFSELGFKFVDKDGKSISTEAENQMKGIDALRKMYRVIVPHMSSNPSNTADTYHHWRLMYRPQEYNVTTDNPIVLFDFKNFQSLNEELLFPISRNVTLCCTKKIIPASLSPKFNLLLDTLLVLKSERFTCCQSQEYLELIVNKFYSMSKGTDLEGYILRDVFNFFE